MTAVGPWLEMTAELRRARPRGGSARCPGSCASGSIGPDGVPVLTLADGRTARFDRPEIHDLVAEIAGPEWSIRPEREISHFDAGALHLITTATLTAISRAASKPVEVERLRPNIVLAVEGPAFSEDDWVGRSLRIGTFAFE